MPHIKIIANAKTSFTVNLTLTETIQKFIDEGKIVPSMCQSEVVNVLKTVYGDLSAEKIIETINILNDMNFWGKK